MLGLLGLWHCTVKSGIKWSPLSFPLGQYFSTLNNFLNIFGIHKGVNPFNSYLTTPCPASFNFSYTKPDDIEKIIRNIRPKSSAWCDNISTKLLKEIENVVSRPLSIIINQSLYAGVFPDKLKIAKVIPLYKKDDNKLFGNYRPIYLLSPISKIFERVAFNQLYDYFSSNGLLYESQYGFRKLHSTELAALEFMDRIIQEMDGKKIPFSIF